VPGLDELWLVVGSAERRYQAVDSVAGIGEHVLNVPFAQALQNEVGDILTHVSPPPSCVDELTRSLQLRPSTRDQMPETSPRSRAAGRNLVSP
jgi:hypothetical protein